MSGRDVLGTLAKVCGAIMGAVAVLGVAYGVALRGGWVINDVEASERIELAQAQVQQRILDESRAREIGDLRNQLEGARSRLRFLNSLRNPSPDDLDERGFVIEQINRIQARLEALGAA